MYLKQFKVVPADDVIQHGEEEDQERPAEEGQDAPNDLDPRLQAERAAAVTRVSTALAELDELRSEKIYFYMLSSSGPGQLPGQLQVRSRRSKDKDQRKDQRPGPGLYAKVGLPRVVKIFLDRCRA